jgi:tetratricopeptide (TPR) repeat protein
VAAPPAKTASVPAAPKTVSKDAPPKENSSTLARRPGETAAAWKTRTRQVQDRYDQASAALDRGEFSAAISGFESLQRDEPGFRDVNARLDQARAGQQSQIQAQAQQAYDAGSKSEKSGELVAAMQQYQRARQLDDSVAGLADAIRRVRDRMTGEGTDAFKRARQYDALGRVPEAIALYERASQLLADDDPNRKVASDRLAALRSAVR